MDSMAWVSEYAHKLDRDLQERLTLGKGRGVVGVPAFGRAGDIAIIVEAVDGATDVLRRGIEELGAPGVRDLSLIGCFAFKATEEQIYSLVQKAAVRIVCHDAVVSLPAPPASHGGQARLQGAATCIGAHAAWRAGAKGQGTTIAIVDTGIYPHMDLAGRIIGFEDLVNGRPSPYDDNGHGTHVAGDAAGDGTASGGLYQGPAYTANLVGIKVLNAQGQGNLSAILAGIDFCIRNRETYGINAINISIQSLATTPSAQDRRCQMVRRAWAAGITVCICAGNEGPAPGTLRTPGIEPLAITVGAVDTNQGCRKVSMAGFSSRGPTIDGLSKPDLVAPGVGIVSLRVPGSTYDIDYPQERVGEWYIKMDGTSMASPIVAGAAACALSYRRTLTPNRVKSLLTSTASHLALGLAPPQDGYTQGSGLLRLDRAISRLQPKPQSHEITRPNACQPVCHC